MIVKYIHPNRDETIGFDVPDGAVLHQFGALCHQCGLRGDRRIVHVSFADRVFSCAARINGERMNHTEWPRLSYQFISDDEDNVLVARVFNRDTSFDVRPTDQIEGNRS